MKAKIQKLHFPHPGEILRTEFLDELGLTQYRLAVDTGIPLSRVSAIVAGRRAITPDTALRLACYFGNSAHFWPGLQKEYDLRRAREEMEDRIAHEVRPLAHA